MAQVATVETLTAEQLAVLDRLTDPTEQALHDAREAVEDLYGEICSLTSARDEDGDDCLSYLGSLAFGASQALERLTELIEEKRG